FFNPMRLDRLITLNLVQPYDFPVKPGSKKWESFKSVDEMYAACQIPESTLNELSTKALIQTCLNFPAPSVLFSQNTPQQGFDRWKKMFNGIKELLARPDATKELLNVYKNFNVKGHEKLATDIEKGSYTLLLQRLEMIIVQDEILSKLVEPQKKQFFKLLMLNYQAIETDSIYGFSNLESTGRIILRIPDVSGDQSIQNRIQSDTMQEFLKTGLLTDRETFLQLITEAKRINANQ
ncbi:MAG: hypothetical protein ABIR18_05295, partial [Chitinophagaceae bacterium]